MSITNHTESELIQLRTSGRLFRQETKQRLKELASEGDFEAERELGRVFPKHEFRANRLEDKQYESRAIRREQRRIPCLVCKTCGKETEKVQEFNAIELRKERRKTWRRVIKPNLNGYVYIGSRKMRNRRLFFAYTMMACIEKKHKLSLAFKDRRNLVAHHYDWARSR